MGKLSADLHKIFPHENIGVVYRNAGNEVKRNFLLTKITVFEFYPARKNQLP